MSIRVMSFNIRFAARQDEGVREWSVRRAALCDFILKRSADIVCMQELLPAQFAYVKSAICEEYDALWYGREAIEDEKGEGLAIAYKKDEWKLVKKDRFWLSETPDVPSKSWESWLYRICVCAVLENARTGERIAVYNVHLDHKSEAARANGIKVVLGEIEKSEHPAYLCGDFNAEKDSAAYASAAAVMADSRFAAKKTMQGITFNLWGDTPDSEDGANVIDYTFFDREAFELLSFEICRDKWGENGENFLSDHYAILSEVDLKK